MLKCFEQHRPDVSGLHPSGVVDKFVSQMCLSRNHHMRAFLADTRNASTAIFGHNSTSGDSRKIFNSGG